MFSIKYKEEIGNKEDIIKVLEQIANGKDIILCCYEKPGDFCHRHILNDILGGDGELDNA